MANGNDRVGNNEGTNMGRLDDYIDHILPGKEPWRDHGKRKYQDCEENQRDVTQNDRKKLFAIRADHVPPSCLLGRIAASKIRS